MIHGALTRDLDIIKIHIYMPFFIHSLKIHKNFHVPASARIVVKCKRTEERKNNNNFYFLVFLRNI